MPLTVPHRGSCPIASNGFCGQAEDLHQLKTVYLEIVCLLRGGDGRDSICRELGISRRHLTRLIGRIRRRDPVVFL